MHISCEATIKILVHFLAHSGPQELLALMSLARLATWRTMRHTCKVLRALQRRICTVHVAARSLKCVVDRAVPMQLTKTLLPHINVGEESRSFLASGRQRVGSNYDVQFFVNVAGRLRERIRWITNCADAPPRFHTLTSVKTTTNEINSTRLLIDACAGSSP
jgi:hypothetical protein